MDDVLKLMESGYSMSQASKELNMDISEVKNWYDKGWHDDHEIYTYFFKQVRKIRYSENSTKNSSKNTNRNSNKSLTNEEKEKIINKFTNLVNSQKCYIDNLNRRSLKKKFTKHYRKLKLSLIIDEHNKKVIENEKKIFADELQKFLNSKNDVIDDLTKSNLKNKYKKPYSDYYKLLKMDDSINDHNEKIINRESEEYLKEFTNFLDTQGFIDDTVKRFLFKKYDKNYYNYFVKLNMNDKIKDHNKKTIISESELYLRELNEYLDSSKQLFNDSDKQDILNKYDKGYYNYYEHLDMENLINKHNDDIFEYVSSKLEDKYISHSEKLDLSKSLNLNFDIDDIIEKHNEEYIKKTAEENKSYFENIDNKSLDKYQIRAVLTDDDNTQIVAGAGTGKTLTLQAKVKYLIEKQGVAPEDILCISFSNSARDDLAYKLEKTLGGNIVDVRTFHSIGYKILGMNDDNRDVPSGKIEELIDSFFKDIVVDKPDLVKDIIEFFSYYYDIIYLNQNNLELETLKSKINRLDEFDEFLKEKMGIKVDEKDDEYVYSIHELIVANYLFIHNIPYESKNELIYNMDENLNNNCFSNFYLPENEIYVNLLDLNANWKDDLENTKENNENIEKINDLVKNSSEKIINIYDYGEDIESILSVLENKLMNYDVNIDELDYINLYEALIIEKNLVEYKNFIKTVKSFINLFKGNAEYMDENGNDISQFKFDKYQKDNHEIFSGSVEKRNHFFLKLINQIYDIYTSYINDYEYIDFDDMINDAVIALKKGAKIYNYKYIIVDEYQDTSHTRYNLLKEMKNRTGAKVVVVGDDWQSIYGFTGCDVSLFSNFDKYFDNPKTVKIPVTYRNSQNLIDVVGNFIQENKNLIPKKLLSAKKESKNSKKKPIKLVGYVSRAEKVLSLINIIDEIAEKNQDAKILVLGRNNNDKFEMSCKDIFTFEEYDDYTKIIYEKYPKLNIEFRTVHKSKGLEADYVMVLNLTDKLNGFPNKMLDDPVLAFVNNKSEENISYPEERRLFYVALTRTKNDVYLFHNDISPSIFIDQIKYEPNVKSLKFVFSNEDIHEMNLLLNKEYDVLPTKLTCPECNSGEIILIVNNLKGTSGFKCSHGCGWNGGPYHNASKGEHARKLAYLKYARVCEWCHHMVLVTPRNKNPKKKFMGCNHFPKCKRAYNLPKDFVDIDNRICRLNSTRNDVYYLHRYVPEKKLKSANEDEVEFHERILSYKDGDDGTIISSITNELMEAITFISNYKIRDKINIVLVAIPSSKVSNRKKATMRKSINIIEKWYNSGIVEHNFGCDKKILNQKDLFKRVIDVPTAHLGEGRADCYQHVKSINCDGECICDEKTVYIVLDDITTSGASMKAGKQILINNGVKEENIYTLAIGATVGDDNEKI